MPGSFDAITCMEMLEHVPDPGSVIAACATLLKPGGRLFLSTLNRTPAAFALAIVGAEYVARLLPKGTHQYREFIKPSELAAWLRDAGTAARGRQRPDAYEPWRNAARVDRAVTDINYLACAGTSPNEARSTFPRWCCSISTAPCSTARRTCWPRSIACAQRRESRR